MREASNDNELSFFEFVIPRCDDDVDDDVLLLLLSNKRLLLVLLKLVKDDADIEVCMRGGLIVVVVKVGHNSAKLWPDVCCISDAASCIFTATILFLSKLPVEFKLIVFVVVALLATKSESFEKLLLKSATFFSIIKKK
jgi:hypothetical protein